MSIASCSCQNTASTKLTSAGRAIGATQTTSSQKNNEFNSIEAFQNIILRVANIIAFQPCCNQIKTKTIFLLSEPKDDFLTRWKIKTQTMKKKS